MTEKTKWNISRKEQISLINKLSGELASLRAKIGVSQGELASLIGISRQTYSAIESGKRAMSWGVYLSLVLIFDFNNQTHRMLRGADAFPSALISRFNNGEEDMNSGYGCIAGIPSSITEKLDSQAMHTIRTVVMVEYARCVNMPGDDVVKAFEGTSIIKSFSELDIRTQKAIESIDEENNS